MKCNLRYSANRDGDLTRDFLDTMLLFEDVSIFEDHLDRLEKLRPLMKSRASAVPGDSEADAVKGLQDLQRVIDLYFDNHPEAFEYKQKVLEILNRRMTCPSLPPL